MEDAHIADLNKGPSKQTQIFGVFDGHGGCEVAKYVSNHFVEEFLKNPNYIKNDIKKALEENYNTMDKLMLEKEGSEELLTEYKKSKEEAEKIKENNKNAQIEMLRQNIDPKEQPDAKISMFTGCTACVLVIHDNKLFFANAGDSRSVLCKKGQAFPIQGIEGNHKYLVTNKEIINDIKILRLNNPWGFNNRTMEAFDTDIKDEEAKKELKTFNIKEENINSGEFKVDIKSMMKCYKSISFYKFKNKDEEPPGGEKKPLPAGVPENGLDDGVISDLFDKRKGILDHIVLIHLNKKYFYNHLIKILNCL